MIPHHSDPESTDSTTKWMEKVAIRSPRKVTCSAAKETFVARRREDVGPGVKMEVMRSVKKVAMAAGAVGWLRVAVSRVGVVY